MGLFLLIYEMGRKKLCNENPGQENPLPPVNTLNLASKDGAVQLPLVEMEKGWPPEDSSRAWAGISSLGF